MLSFARPNSTGKGAKGAEDLIAYSDSVSSNSWPDEAMTREFAREPFSIIENSITVVPLSPPDEGILGIRPCCVYAFSHLKQIWIVLCIRTVKIYGVHGAIFDGLPGIFH